MTKRRNDTLLAGALFGVLGVLGVSVLGGCGEQVEDFIVAEGSYGDGRPLAFREQMRRYICDASKATAPCVSLMGLRTTADAGEALRGVRMNYTPSKMSGPMTYTSGLLEPITLYIVQAREDRFVDASVQGGEITFTSLATKPGEITAGSFRNMVLRRVVGEGEVGDEQTILTLASGSFQYLQL
jgi:hypothetical protein